MTTITVVKKKQSVTIAADTLTKWGATKESASYIVNHEKIFQVSENFIAVTGNATFKQILNEYFSGKDHVDLSSVDHIFKEWNQMHLVLKQRYYVLPEEDKEDALESSRMDVLIANKYGIFGVSGHRTVQEFSKFYAYGSGSEYALGALWANYNNPNMSSSTLAREAIEAAAEFDDATGLPTNYFSLELQN